MSLTAPLNAQSDFEFPDNGQYLAICHVIADMGIQHWEYQGQEKIGQKVHFGFELVKNYPRKGAPPSSATMKDGRPFGVSIQLPYSGHENSNMRKLLGTWRGEPFNDHELIGPEAPGYQLNSYLGGPALITIQKSTSTTGKTWANIVEITRALEPLVPEAFNPLVWFDFGNFNPAAFDMLPKWLQDRIKPTQD